MYTLSDCKRVLIKLRRADYLHCCILFSCLLVLVLATYTRGDVIGSPGKLYDLLLDASKVNIRLPQILMIDCSHAIDDSSSG